MIIKIFLSNLKISKYTLLIIFLSFICGLIKEISAIFILIIFHEFGHFFASYLFKWKIDKIIIYPFGGLTIYNEIIDKPFIEELLITIFGPINQSFLYLLFYIFNKNNLVTDSYFYLIRNYHYSTLLFNLLPIVPLDGSKLLNIYLNKMLNYRFSYNTVGIISIIFILLLIYIFKNNLSYYMIITFLIFELYNYVVTKKYMFNRFIFEKYLYKNDYKKIVKVNNINKMKRNKKHLIKYNNIYITEKEAIKKIKGV